MSIITRKFTFKSVNHVILCTKVYLTFVLGTTYFCVRASVAPDQQMSPYHQQVCLHATVCFLFHNLSFFTRRVK